MPLTLGDGQDSRVHSMNAQKAASSLQPKRFLRIIADDICGLCVVERFLLQNLRIFEKGG